jgi:hypothetical protein
MGNSGGCCPFYGNLVEALQHYIVDHLYHGIPMGKKPGNRFPLHLFGINPFHHLP